MFILYSIPEIPRVPLLIRGVFAQSRIDAGEVVESGLRTGRLICHGLSGYDGNVVVFRVVYRGSCGYIDFMHVLGYYLEKLGIDPDIKVCRVISRESIFDPKRI